MSLCYMDFVFFFQQFVAKSLIHTTFRVKHIKLDVSDCTLRGLQFRILWVLSENVQIRYMVNFLG